MRKLKRQIKRAYIDRISPGNKPKNKSYALRSLTEQSGFKQWREQLAKNAKRRRKQHEKPTRFYGLV
ncbi:hypothetical protein FDZ71_00395 [bacterium]|nr:MAG: hypothetical protein FDZ71_00395 [bacterium]